MFQNDAVVLGIIFSILGLVFWTSESKHPFFKKFYAFIPGLLLCYFIPGFLNSFGIISSEKSNLYYISSRYLLPACLVLMTMSADIPAVFKLGPKALIMFFTGMIGVILGAPLALWVAMTFFPDMITGIGFEEFWRGMTTIAGAWIGGGPNQASMKEIFEVGDGIFSIMVVIDILMGTLWMAFMLFCSAKSKSYDEKMKTDTSAIEELKAKVSAVEKVNSHIPTTSDFMYICAIAFGGTGIAHLVADNLAPFIQRTAPELAKFSLTSSFFWLIFVATLIGVSLSFTKVKKLEGAGASKIASVFLYVLIGSVGMQMNIFEIFKWPALFFIGFIWIAFHGILVFTVGRLIKAPMFFMVMGSQGNIGGAASAPIVASSFHPSLATVGVLLAVFSYIIGTYAAWLCGILLSKM